LSRTNFSLAIIPSSSLHEIKIAHGVSHRISEKEPTIGFEPMATPLPRVRSTD
jgi:hypothetical protein